MLTSESPHVVVVGGALALALVTAYRAYTRRGAHPRPPGPKRLPLLGNLLNFPQTNQSETFAKWAELYGEVVYAQVLGQHIVFLNSVQAIEEVMNKRAAISSHRPKFYMAGELAGLEWGLVFKQPGPELREERKLLHQGMGPKGVDQWWHLLESGSATLVNDLSRGTDYSVAFGDFVAETITRFSYGETVWNEHGQELIDMNKEGMDIFLSLLGQVWLVDMLPMLRYVPSWLPGAGFKRWAAEIAIHQKKIQTRGFKYYKEVEARGIVEPSLITQLLEAEGHPDRVRDAVAVEHGAGYDTTHTFLVTFCLAMLMYPKVQKKAQEEIDRVVEHSRLPKVADRPSLPYVNALHKEVGRWHTIAPTGLPHRTMEDQEWQGMCIPKGTILQPNIRLILHDPQRYSDPHTFYPDRFIDGARGGLPADPDPTVFMFGFGRRVCPGRHFADRATFCAIAHVLAAFDIVPSPEEPAPISLEFQEAIVSPPKPFKCTFAPRPGKAGLFKSDH